MAQAASKAVDQGPIEPLATAIDRSHLAHMTFGDPALERELLQLFERQAELLIARMRANEPPAVAALAHTLKGSALGVGAASVARAAAATELACTSGAAERDAALDRLAEAIDEACAAIAGLLRES